MGVNVFNIEVYINMLLSSVIQRHCMINYYILLHDKGDTKSHTAQWTRVQLNTNSCSVFCFIIQTSHDIDEWHWNLSDSYTWYFYK